MRGEPCARRQNTCVGSNSLCAEESKRLHLQATLALRFQGETDKVKWMPFQAKGTAPTRHLQGKRASMLNYKLFSRGWDSEGWLESKRGRQITQGLSALAGLVSPQFRPVVLTL